MKEKGIECYFEKENIWTFDGKGELLITIMSSLAQEESRSISENVTWGQRKRMADGKVSIPFKHTLGFKRGPKGEFLVDEEQAKTIRDIYDWFLKGLTPHAIGARLTENGVPCAIGIADACTVAAVSAISTELGRRFIPIPFLGPLTTGEGIQRGLLQK